MKAGSLTLSLKGLLLMVVILALELIFFGTYFSLVQQAEDESVKQQQTKEIINRASKLLLRMYEAGDKVGKYGIHREDDPSASAASLAAYLRARDEIPKQIAWLKRNLKDQPSQLALIGKIEENVEVGLELLESMRIASDTKPHWEAMKFGLEQRNRLAPRIEELVRDLRDFMGQERAIEGRLPALQQEKREATKVVLIGGAVLNGLVVLIVLWFFHAVLTKRLNVLVENFDKLKDGEPLHTQISGGDEIAKLDAAFHKMASSLRGEEALLRASENAVISMISQMPAGLMILNSVGRIEFVNPALANQLGYDQDALENFELSELFTAGGGAPVPTFRWLKDNSDGRVVELIARKSDGAEFPVELSSADISTDKAEHRLAMVLDVSERHEVEKLRQAFVAMVSHELRTPLASVSMFLELLGMGVFGRDVAAVETDLAVATRQTEQVIMLINDLLDLEKLEANKLELVKSESEVEDLVDRAVEAVAGAVETADILLLFDGSQEIVTVDPERVVQALTKMLAAVIQLTPSGEEVSINVVVPKKTRQLLSSAPPPVVIEIQVASLYIPEVHVDSMFERFQQINLPGASQGAWLGLGLALSRAIIEQHGGEVGLRVEEGAGCTFWMQIPKF
jgi:PAS domain S-box-containing protein